MSFLTDSDRVGTSPGLAVPLCAACDPVHSPLFHNFLALGTFLGEYKVVVVAHLE